MLKNVSFAGKLAVLSSALLIPMLVIGAMSLVGMSALRQDVEVLFSSQQATLTAQRILFFVAEGRSQAALGLQHNPELEYSKLHDHPLTMHTDAMQRSHDEIVKLLAALKSLNLPEEEKKLADTWGTTLELFIKDGLAPTKATLVGGDYHKAMQELLKKTNPRLAAANKQGNELVQLLEAASAKEQRDSELNFSRSRTTILSLTTLALSLAVGLAFLLTRSMSNSLNAVVTAAESAVKDNDFTRDVPVSGRDETGRAAQAFNHLMDKLRTIVRESQDSSTRITAAADAQAQSMEQMVAASCAQSEAASNVAATVEQISASLSETASLAEHGMEFASKTQQDVDRALGSTRAAITETQHIADTVRQASASVASLSQSSARIGGIVSVIREIADQTNLLALNAAIEAARAGEQGRGFAVVADEVRKLAERTTLSTQEISSLVAAIQGQVEQTVGGMLKADEQTSHSFTAAQESSSALELVDSSSRRISQGVKDIAQAVREQSTGVNEIVQNTIKIAEMAEQNGVTAKHHQKITTDLDALARSLRDNAKRYRI